MIQRQGELPLKEMIDELLKKMLAVIGVTMLLAAPAWSQSADTVLLNGKIVTLDDQFPTREALAIRDGRIVALGTTAAIRKLAGKKSQVIDLKGHTVIPGLIDSHMHAIRAALSFSTEVNWIGASSLAEAVARIHEASQTMKPGAWLIVAGGWNVQQFKEKRRPTQAELLAAAPNNPVYNNVSPEDYQAVFQVWREGRMTVRVAYSLCGPTPGAEFAELKDLTQMLPMGFGDDMLRFNGLGERITWAMNNNNKPSDADKRKYYEIARWAAQRGMSITMHWPNEESVDQLLTIFERVNREVPITGLRWSIAHLNNASPESLRRMKALGMGWTVQGEPPVMIATAKEVGVAVGAGTDAHRVASYNPFTALQRFLGGIDRMDALRYYTLGSAWFSHEENNRGSLTVGKLADLAVLTKDYMTVPVEQVSGIESLLTMVGGKIVYTAEDKW